MRNWLAKSVSAALASIVLFAALGCGEKKSPPRYVDDKDLQKEKKSPDAR